MALTLEDLSSLKATVRDVAPDPSGSSVRFRLARFCVSAINEDSLSPCSCPLVVGRLILSKAEVQCGKDPVPECFQPDRLEETLQVHLRAVCWKNRYSQEAELRKKAPALSGDLLFQAAFQFLNSNPNASGMDFMQAAMTTFKQADESYVRH